MTGIHQSHHTLIARWRTRFRALPAPAREALTNALLDLRTEALERARLSWARHKAPMACYWKVVAVYASHFAKTLSRKDTP